MLQRGSCLVITFTCLLQHSYFLVVKLRKMRWFSNKKSSNRKRFLLFCTDPIHFDGIFTVFFFPVEPWRDQYHLEEARGCLALHLVFWFSTFHPWTVWLWWAWIWAQNGWKWPSFQWVIIFLWIESKNIQISSIWHLFQAKTLNQAKMFTFQVITNFKLISWHIAINCPI